MKVGIMKNKIFIVLVLLFMCRPVSALEITVGGNKLKVLCLDTIDKNSQVVYTVGVFYDRTEAEQFAHKHDGEVIKEHDKELYYVIDKTALKFCSNFIFVEVEK
jgi:hypothetical protein